MHRIVHLISICDRFKMTLSLPAAPYHITSSVATEIFDLFFPGEPLPAML
jgi:hypothetical protein